MSAITFEQYLQSRGHSKATVKAYHFYLLDFLSWLDRENVPPETVSGTDLTGWLHYLQKKGLANITRANSLIAVRHFLDWQVQRSVREDNPARLIKIRGAKTRKLYPLLSREELEGIYHQYCVPGEQEEKSSRNWFAPYRLSRQRNKAMLGLIVYQGLLTSEVNDLAVSDLRLREGTVFVTGSRKSNERTLELKPQQIMELMEYQMMTRKTLLKEGGQDSPLLFLPAPAPGRRAGADSAIHTWKRLTCDVAAQHPRFINFLQVRTSVITHWLKQYNLRQVQYMAGHKYASTTEGYIVNQTEDLLNDIDQFHPIG